MPTVKIAEPYHHCNHPEHFPPSMYRWDPGVYRHTCPACGYMTQFTVPEITCKSWSGGGSLNVRWDDQGRTTFGSTALA